MIEQLSLSQKHVTSEEAVSHNSLYYQRISIARSQVSFYAIVTCIWSKCHVSCSGFRETLGLMLTRVTRPNMGSMRPHVYVNDTLLVPSSKINPKLGRMWPRG